MRARLVRPEFWTDSKVAKLPEGVRLFYIGLWCVADDAGYLEWDVAKIGAELMQYRPVAARERRVAELAKPLIDEDRVQLLNCGRHAVIPTLTRHRIAGGNTSQRVESDHVRICQGRVRTSSTDKSRSESLLPSLSESDSPSPSVPPRRRATTNGKNDQDEKIRAIARARSKLEDPASSEDVKRAARFSLERLGASV